MLTVVHHIGVNVAWRRNIAGGNKLPDFLGPKAYPRFMSQAIIGCVARAFGKDLPC